jgi:hypothetical protein
VAAAPPPGYVPYDQVQGPHDQARGPHGREQGDASASGSGTQQEASAADKAVALGKRFAGNVGTGLKKLGAFVEEKASSHASNGGGTGQASSGAKR